MLELLEQVKTPLAVPQRAEDSCQEAKGRAVQYARIACALKQEARKLERQAEQFLEDAAAERKK